MATFPAELSRAWRRYFTATETARVSSDVLSVVILEDLTRGPYPPCRLWQAGDASAAVVADYSVLTLRNNGQRGSVVVVDKIITRVVQTQIVIASSTAGFALAANGGSKIATDRAPEAQAHSYSSGELFVGDISLAKQKSNAAIGYDTLPVPTGTAFQIDGPWIIGQGGELILRTVAINVGVDAWFAGRYYTLS